MYTLVRAEIWTIARTDQGNAVLIRPIGSEIAVPIFIGQLETQSILIGFGDVTIPRPLTHDLMISLIKHLGAELLRIEITDLKEGTFYARLVLQSTLVDENEFMLDCRPSDALALAVRLKCPVYISEQVVQEAGVSVNLIVDAATASAAEDLQNLADDQQEGNQSRNEGIEDEFLRDGMPISPPQSAQAQSKEAQRRALQAELERAVANEEYERAAKLRDLLAALGED
ncbi:MAG TPA: bifunctional nuclease family protein [Treponema sp.]|nr:bifunctional nuclease family protein [Treponema sp.]HPC70984.1 bifunctional nuclease family protein [Treponema sp.]HRS03756.1 bifunctional nuclease family protein [Treponema sp.]HRU27678.1 bifunctional nuclease family protein [Treponema sp.]